MGWYAVKQNNQPTNQPNNIVRFLICFYCSFFGNTDELFSIILTA